MIGDAFVFDSSLKLLNYDQLDVLDIRTVKPGDVERYNAEYDYVFLRGSNYIHSHMDWENAEQVLPKLKIPILAFGVGAQAPKEGKIQLLFNQTAFNEEWTGGGTSSIAGNLALDYNFNYRSDVFASPELAEDWAASGGEGDWGVPTSWQQVQAQTQFLTPSVGLDEQQQVTANLIGFSVMVLVLFFFTVETQNKVLASAEETGEADHVVEVVSGRIGAPDRPLTVLELLAELVVVADDA